MPKFIGDEYAKREVAATQWVEEQPRGRAGGRTPSNPDGDGFERAKLTQALAAGSSALATLQKGDSDNGWTNGTSPDDDITVYADNQITAGFAIPADSQIHVKWMHGNWVVETPATPVNDVKFKLTESLNRDGAAQATPYDWDFQTKQWSLGAGTFTVREPGMMASFEFYPADSDIWASFSYGEYWIVGWQRNFSIRAQLLADLVKNGSASATIALWTGTTWSFIGPQVTIREPGLLDEGTGKYLSGAIVTAKHYQGEYWVDDAACSNIQDEPV